MPVAPSTGETPAARAVPAEGDPFAAALAGVDGNWQITLDVGGKPRTMPAADLAWWGTCNEPAKGPVVVLARGGLLACTSPRFDDIFGLSAGRAHGMPFLDLVATVDQERVAEALAPFAAEQPEARVRAEHVQLTFDALRTDGSVFEAELLVDHPRSPANNLALGGDL